MKPEDIEHIKELLPTSLGSAEIREQIAADILRRSIVSARMEHAHYLAKVRDVCAEISAGTINQADARAQLMNVLSQMGHSPTDEGGLANPASIRRLNLIIDTQRQMAASVAQMAQQNEGTVDQFPAWELTRLGTRRAPREDWPARWRAAGESVGWEGASRDSFVALKNSPIWQALGDGAGGYTDTLGNPYPPFAYSSGMAWLQVDRATCERMGLVQPEDEAPVPDMPSLSPAERDILEAARRTGFADLFKDLA